MSKRKIFVIQSGGLTEPGAAAGAAASAVSAGMAGLRLTRGCLSALGRFRDAGYGPVLLVDPATDPGDEVVDFLVALASSQGIPFAAIRRCVHAAGEACDCALPGIGLVAEFIADAGLDRAQSLVVGRGDRIAGLARAMGVPAVDLAERKGWAAVAHEILDRPRRARIRRKTRETDIEVAVDLDASADPAIRTGLGFFDHMLEQLGKHGGFTLEVTCHGDLEVDEHHTIEDVALAVGQALKEALGDKRGIGRYGFLLPMDEAEAQVAIDLSGRAYAVFEGEFPRERVGEMPTELVGHFFRSLGDALGAALHVSVRGDNAHHMVEACFKGVARALRQALARSGSELPSTKGTL